MRVLFLYPNARGMNMLPTAIAIFSSLFKQEGHECRVFDTTYWELPEEGFFNNDEVKEKYLHVRPNQKSPIDVSITFLLPIILVFMRSQVAFSPEGTCFKAAA